MLSGCDDETTISHKDKAIKVQRTLSPEELIAKTEKAYYFDGLDAFKDQIRTRTDVEADVKKKMLRILNRRKNTTHIVENMSDLKHSPLQETGVPRDFGALL